MITFYDIPSTFPLKSWSPNVWKARYCLNFKGIPYKTEWVEYPDIEEVCKRMGIPPSSKKADGSPAYTLPAIYDDTTKTGVSDSFKIAQYLDSAYPDTPRAFPAGTAGLQAAFLSAYIATSTPLVTTVMPIFNRYLNPKSEAYFRRTREITLGGKLEELIPRGKEREENWAKVKAEHDKIDKWLAETEKEGPFVMGATISFADCIVAAYTLRNRLVFGEDSEEWNDMKTWNGGRWVKFLDNMKKYEVVV